MKFITTLTTLLLLVASSNAAKHVGPKRRTKQLRNYMKQGARKLASVDREVQCYGGCENFETQASSSANDESIFIFKYPTVNTGDQIQCNLECSTNTGEGYLQGVVTTANTINSSSEGTKTDSSSGCPITVNVQAERSANLLVAAYCENGCTAATMRCDLTQGFVSRPLIAIKNAIAPVFNSFFNGHSRRLTSTTTKSSKYYMRGSSQ